MLTVLHVRVLQNILNIYHTKKMPGMLDAVAKTRPARNKVAELPPSKLKSGHATLDTSTN